MEINEQAAGGLTILRPVGRIDNDTSAEFQDKLLARLGGGSVLVDFTSVEFISSAGLAALMTAAKQAKATSRRVGVAALGSVVQEIFAISRFARVVPVYASAAEGIAALQ
jgi:anti-anti-sigma factor